MVAENLDKNSGTEAIVSQLLSALADEAIRAIGTKVIAGQVNATFEEVMAELEKKRSGSDREKVDRRISVLQEAKKFSDLVANVSKPRPKTKDPNLNRAPNPPDNPESVPASNKPKITPSQRPPIFDEGLARTSEIETKRFSDKAECIKVLSGRLIFLLRFPRQGIKEVPQIIDIVRQNNLVTDSENVGGEIFVERALKFTFGEDLIARKQAEVESLDTNTKKFQGLANRLEVIPAQIRKSPEFITAMVGDIHDFAPDLVRPNIFTDPLSGESIALFELSNHLRLNAGNWGIKKSIGLALFGPEKMGKYEKRFGDADYLKSIIPDAKSLFHGEKDGFEEKSGREIYLGDLEDAFEIRGIENIARELFPAEEVEEAILERTKEDADYLLDPQNLKDNLNSLSNLRNTNPLRHQDFAKMGLERARLALGLPKDKSLNQIDTRRAIHGKITQAHLDYVEEEIESTAKIEAIINDDEAMREIIGDFRPYFDDYLKAPKNLEIGGKEISLSVVYKVRGNYLRGTISKDQTKELIIEIFRAPAKEYREALKRKAIEKKEKKEKKEKEKKEEKKNAEKRRNTYLTNKENLKNLIGDFKPYFDNYTSAPKAFYSEVLGCKITFAKIAQLNNQPPPDRKNTTHNLIYWIFEEEAKDYALSKGIEIQD